MLIGALTMTSLFMVVEAVVGFVSGSLALIADAGHMLTDSASLALALFAIAIAKRPASAERTYGYNRAEILAAAVNALSLWMISAWILWESIQRFIGWRDAQIEGGMVLIFGGIGMLVNIIAAYMLHGPSEYSLNVEGALQHVITDIMGSAGVLVSGIVILVFSDVEWIVLVDPFVSVLIALLIVLSSWNLLTSVLTVLIEGVPDHLDLYKLCAEVGDVPGVTFIHDVHAWTVTSGYVSLTMHVLVDPDHSGDHDDLLGELRRIATHEHGISHCTFQLEKSARGCTEDHHVNHLLKRESERKRRKFVFGHTH